MPSLPVRAVGPASSRGRRDGVVAIRSAVRGLVVACAVVLLAGCSAPVAQNPPGKLRPVNAVADGGDERVMLHGHDVVAYWTQGRHAQGDPAIRSVYEGVTFRFASAEHKALFDRSPEKYLPQYGGYCANGIAYGIPWGGDADAWRIENGRLFIFGGAASKAAFELDVARNTDLADRYWRDEVAGSHSFVQRAWRLVWRVPHYKSGAELAAEVAAAKGR